MAKNKISLTKKYDVPQTFIYLVFGIGVVLIVSFFLPSADLGLIKTPAAQGKNAVYVLVSGIILVISSCLFFVPFFTETATMNAPGYYIRSEDFQRDLSKFITEAKSEIVFWGGNFYLSTEERRDDILNRLAEGVNVKYLIFNPQSPLKDEASRDFGEITNKFEGQCVMTIDNLIDLETEWEIKRKSVKTPGELEVRLYKNMPRLRAYFFDADDETSHSFFVHFLYQTDSSSLPMFSIVNGRNSAFTNYLNSFKSHWRSREVITLSEYKKSKATSI